MGAWIELEAGDGHRFRAWHAVPAQARGGVVVLQEIFGVNDHIRELAEDFCALGYEAVAPALFDRVAPATELGYGEDDLARGRALRAALATGDVMRDVAAARAALAGRAAAVGYCWGGTLAWLAACRLDLACAVGYYGSATVDFLDRSPACPMTLMLGESDETFPPAAVGEIAARHPGVTIFTYPAGHGFACPRRGSWHEPSARLARERTADILLRHLG